MNSFESAIAARLQRRYARLVGRGTTALYVALRALERINGAGEIILPDVICSTVLDAVLLAGDVPVFADVIPNRFTIDPVDIREKINAQTRGVIVAHLFGHVADVPNFGVPLIEDAVQGLGGNVGTLGDISFISFDDSKMIGGRGGVVLTDDPGLAEAIQGVSLSPGDVSRLPSYSPAIQCREHIQSYWPQLEAMRERLIRPFDESAENVERIEAGWQKLAGNVQRRNENALWLSEQLAGLPITLPEVRAGDAIWRYTLTAPNAAAASWILRRLQIDGLRGSSLYLPLSRLFAPNKQLFSATLERRLINLWVDLTVDKAELKRAVEIIRSAPNR